MLRDNGESYRRKAESRSAIGQGSVIWVGIVKNHIAGRGLLFRLLFVTRSLRLRFA